MQINTPPMELGQVLDGKDPDGNLTNEDKLGMVHTFPCVTLTGGPTRSKGPNTGRAVTAVLLRNTSGLTLLGKRLGQLDRTAGYAMTKNVDGYSTTLANQGVVVIDPNLPSTGVADDDIFWGIISGPALVLVPIAGADMNGDIAVNAPLVSSTGTTTGATTSGRVSNVTVTAATAGNTLNGYDGFKMAYAVIGRAMSARTTGETTAGTDILIDTAINLFGR
jgi:hypothetical protein